MKFTIFQKENVNSQNNLILVKESAIKRGLIYDDKNPDLVIFIGGDGTFLKCLQHYVKDLDKLLFVGLNIGNLGFFYDYDLLDLNELLEAIVKNKYSIEKLHLLKATVACDDNVTRNIYAVNEIRIENPFHTLISDVSINNTLLETFRGTGLLVSTAIGSSGYSRSLGGAFVDSKLNLIQLTEIAGIQNNAYRSLGNSLVLSGDDVITLCGDFSHAVIGYDCFVSDYKAKEIRFSSSDKVASIICKKGHSYVGNISRSFIK